jgi:hypothetical protein
VTTSQVHRERDGRWNQFWVAEKQFTDHEKANEYARKLARTKGGIESCLT